MSLYFPLPPSDAARVVLAYARAHGTTAHIRAAEYDATEERDSTGKWTKGVSTNLKPALFPETAATIKQMPEASEFLIDGHTYQASGTGSWSTSAGGQLSSDQMAQNLPSLISAGLLPNGQGLSVQEQALLQTELMKKVKKHALSTPQLAYILAGAADGISTAMFLSNGKGVEADPLINWIHSPVEMMAFGVGLDALAMWGWKKVTKDHTKTQAVGFYVAAFVRGSIAVRNVQIARGKRGLGGHGSGNFGHAGRPGEVGGSADALHVVGSAESSSAVREHLATIPETLLKESKVNTIYAMATEKEAKEKIDAYLLKHYGFTASESAKGLVDRERGVMYTLTDPKNTFTQFSHSLVDRIQSPEWRNVTRGKSAQESEDLFAKHFADAFTGLVTLGDPTSLVMEGFKRLKGVTK